MHIVIFIGTRPEAIKLAPVVRALRENKLHKVTVCTTGQHREMLAQALEDFDIVVDHSLNVMEPNQSLAGLTTKLLGGCDQLLDELKPDWVLVQGDTTTVLSASLAAFYRNIKIGHVEAGLRSFQKNSPFPEEVNRKLTSVLADLHFCPTERSRQNLLKEGISNSSIIVTGNTVIDAVLSIRKKILGAKEFLPSQAQVAHQNGQKLILVTCHRRESFGKALSNILEGLLRIAQNHPDCLIVFPVHLNPQVRNTVFNYLGGVKNILLIDPIPYKSLIAVLDLCYLVITDSGGLQEEAPALAKPVVVLRDVTERPEGVDAGVACLVGTDTENIVQMVDRLLIDRSAYLAMAAGKNPYGDGKASERIMQAIYE